MLITLPGEPRTKKTGNRIVRTGAGKIRILPSAIHEQWFRGIMARRSEIVRGIQEKLPLAGPVSIDACFYCSGRGDITGYLQALADVLEDRKVSRGGKLLRDGLGIIQNDRQVKQLSARFGPPGKNPRIEAVIHVLDGFE